jgi:hypothetical protein
VEVLDGFAGFVGLQVTNQMPGDVGRSVRLACLAIASCTRLSPKWRRPLAVGGSNGLHRQKLRHRNQRNGGRNGLAHALKVIGQGTGGSGH